MLVHRNWSIFKTSDMNINFWANIYNFCGFKIFLEKWYNLGGFFGDHPLSSDVISFLNGESVNFNDVVQSFWNKDFWVFDFGARTAGCNSPLQRWSIVTKYLHIIFIEHKVFSTSILVKFLPQVGMRACCIHAFVFAWFMVQIKSLTNHSHNG